MLKKGKVRKVGNSLGLTLPLEFVRALGLQDGDEVTLRLTSDAIVMEKFDADLLHQMESFRTELKRFKHTFKSLE